MQSYEKPECTQIRVKFVINATASVLHTQSITSNQGSVLESQSYIPACHCQKRQSQSFIP